MGVEDYLMTAVLRGVLAQRLVRRLCPLCKTPYTPPAALVQELQLDRFTSGEADHPSSRGGLRLLPPYRL